MKSGIIYLNGVTSTGKSSIARELQRLAGRSMYVFSNDIFAELVSPKYIRSDFWKYLGDAIYNMYLASAAMAKDGGAIVIIDGMLTNEPGLVERFGNDHYTTVKNCYKDVECCIVEVVCPLEECRRRNIARGDRSEFQSERQWSFMDKEGKRDFSVDSFKNSAEECARQILEYLVIPMNE